MPALLGAVLAGVLLLAGIAGPTPLVLGVVLVQALLTLAAIAPAPVAAAHRSAWLALVVGVTASLGERWLDTDALVVAVAALGLGFVAAIVLQLTRRDGRALVSTSMSLTSTAMVTATLLVWWVAARDVLDGEAIVAYGLVGAGVTLLATAAPLPGPRTLWRVAGAVVATGSAWLLAEAGWPLPADALRTGTVAAAAIAAASAAAVVTALTATDRLESGDIPDDTAGGVPGDTPGDAGPIAATTRLTLAPTVALALAAPAAYLVGVLLVA